MRSTHKIAESSAWICDKDAEAKLFQLIAEEERE